MVVLAGWVFFGRASLCLSLIVFRIEDLDGVDPTSISAGMK